MIMDSQNDHIQKRGKTIKHQKTSENIYNQDYSSEMRSPLKSLVSCPHHSAHATLPGGLDARSSCRSLGQRSEMGLPAETPQLGSKDGFTTPFSMVVLMMCDFRLIFAWLSCVCSGCSGHLRCLTHTSDRSPQSCGVGSSASVGLHLTEMIQ